MAGCYSPNVTLESGTVWLKLLVCVHYLIGTAGRPSSFHPEHDTAENKYRPI